MANFDYGMQFMVIKTGRIGMLVDKNRSKFTLSFLDKDPGHPEKKVFKKSELKDVNDRSVKASVLAKYIKGMLSFKELTEGTNLLQPNLDNTPRPYKITIKDLLAGLSVYKDRSYSEISHWIDTIVAFEDGISFSDDPYEDIQDKVTNQDVLNYVWLMFDRFTWDFDSIDDSSKFLIDLKNDLSLWVESKGKEIPVGIMRSISQQYDDDTIDAQSEATQKLFKRCLDAMCDMKDPRSIQRRGYCYYCGTKIYPNNWVKARDAFIEYYNLTGDASAANTLGYIYYYGRCNNGVPEYDEAFKYFSIGHAFTYYESTYKLADMFAHGYGVVKDEKTANHLYWSVYDQNLTRFINGDYECKFADAALRIGNCFRYGYGEEVDIGAAYYYYLQADLAIRKRIEAANHYGDTVVFNGIQHALEEVRQQYHKKGRTLSFNYPRWIDWTLIDHRWCKIKIHELKGGVLSLKASPVSRRDESSAPMMLITVAKSDYCELRDSIHVKTSKNSSFKVIGDGNEFTYDSYDYDWDGSTSFYLGDELVAEIKTDHYSFTAPARKEIKPEGKIYHFVSIVFGSSNRKYDYICDDTSVKEGDKVIINGYDGETEVTVVDVFDKYENQLGLPLERYKKIIRKI
ncbi:MAG: sel1 repeat family protein [Clostridiales bacterium]|nr:sel1 repeat family protein [Clostridiales bacterium]